MEKTQKSKKNTEIWGTREVNHIPYFSDAAVMTIDGKAETHGLKLVNKSTIAKINKL